MFEFYSKISPEEYELRKAQEQRTFDALVWSKSWEELLKVRFEYIDNDINRKKLEEKYQEIEDWYLALDFIPPSYDDLDLSDIRERLLRRWKIRLPKHPEDISVLSDLEGRMIEQINISQDEIEINLSCGKSFKLYHRQDCCENVYIEDVNGDPQDLVGVELLLAQERSSDAQEDLEKDKGYCDSATWTFYTFRTQKGCLDVRFLGESNGYYSEGVDFEFNGYWKHLMEAK